MADKNALRLINDLYTSPLTSDEFELSPTFLSRFRDREVPWGAVGEVTYLRTYSRYQDPEVGGAFRLVEPGENEQWWQTVARVVEGVFQTLQRHAAQVGVPFEYYENCALAEDMYQRIFEFKMLPPGRGLWMMGTDWVRKNGSAALLNCSFLSTREFKVPSEFATIFGRLMDLSMLGVGVGFDTRGAGKLTLQEPVYTTGAHIIPDSREGWIHAVKRMLNAFAGIGTLPGSWDYSNIRAAGTPLKGFGGVAGGPESLRRLLEDHLPRILGASVGKPITSETIVDVGNAIGVCVVSGNLRRSAEIALGNPNDDLFLGLKDPEKAGNALMETRWVSNNTVIVENDDIDFSKTAPLTVKNGEPGYLFLDTMQKYGRLCDGENDEDDKVLGCNPCGEIQLEPNELCNLAETFPARHDDLDDYLKTLKLAYVYAKTVTLIPTHIDAINDVMLANRRLGISQSGIVQAYEKIGRAEHIRWCDSGYQLLRELDLDFSYQYRVPTSIKLTTVKPSGSVSKLPGSTAGAHYAIAEHYIQRIRFGKTSKLLPKLVDAGYKVEQDVYDPSAMVVEFPVKESLFSKGETEVSAAQQMEDLCMLQTHWADNMVSVTIKFHQEREGPEIQKLLEEYRYRLKSVSFLPYSDDGQVWAQAPWEAISAEEYDRRQQALHGGLETVHGDAHEVNESFCDGETCQIF